MSEFEGMTGQELMDYAFQELAAERVRLGAIMTALEEARAKMRVDGETIPPLSRFYLRDESKPLNECEVIDIADRCRCGNTDLPDDEYGKPNPVCGECQMDGAISRAEAQEE